MVNTFRPLNLMISDQVELGRLLQLILGCAIVLLFRLCPDYHDFGGICTACGDDSLSGARHAGEGFVLTKIQ
uniref:Uncharacterized protein n=1 Tax=Sinocyclocheilus rhinocerous TaxID=307959 RepID=A0A673H9J7_9TELE